MPCFHKVWLESRGKEYSVPFIYLRYTKQNGMFQFFQASTVGSVGTVVVVSGTQPEKVAGQVGLKSSRPVSQVGLGSTRPESTRPGVDSIVTFEKYMFGN